MHAASMRPAHACIRTKSVNIDCICQNDLTIYKVVLRPIAAHMLITFVPAWLQLAAGWCGDIDYMPKLMDRGAGAC